MEKWKQKYFASTTSPYLDAISIDV